VRFVPPERRYLKAGDALIFNDHLLHGSTARINPGQRRMVCFRYLPQHNSTNRFGKPYWKR
jgi:ectoine hydroxylase-related dioxygenase (phytanoyl-CoA dioxygenase family)